MQTSPTKIEEKPKTTPQTGEHALKQVDVEIPVQGHHSKAQVDEQQLQLVSTKPKERAINSSDLMLLLETQVPNLPITLQISKSNPCNIPNLLETSVHSGFQEQFAMFDINKLSKFVRKFAADFYLSSLGFIFFHSSLIIRIMQHLPSTPWSSLQFVPTAFSRVFLVSSSGVESL